MIIYTQNTCVGISWLAEDENVRVHLWQPNNGFIYKLRIFDKRKQTNEHEVFQDFDEAMEAVDDVFDDSRGKLVHLLRQKDAKCEARENPTNVRLLRADLYYTGGESSPSCALG